MDGQVKEALKKMAKLENPRVVRKDGTGGSWVLCYEECEEVIKERRVGHYVGERWGEAAARIFRILREVPADCEARQLLPSEHISEVAMLPEKVTREVLHKLYIDGMVEFHDFPTSKQHAYNQTVYLWGADTRKVMGSVEDSLR